MNTQKRIDALVLLGKALREKLNPENELFQTLCSHAYLKNNWFTKENIFLAAGAWADLLSEKNISAWVKPYLQKLNEKKFSSKVGVINAGNIPFVGLHDFISVLLTNNFYSGKNSSEDNLLLPFVASMLAEIEPEFKNRIQFLDRLTDFDAVIATGSNNSSRYFESYFGKYPHIIRKNRNAVAVLSGLESNEELQDLGNDIFQYFGLGCRNVSKLYVPQDYDFKNFFEAIYKFNQVMQHNKYMNNFDYVNAVLLMKQVPFLQNGFLIVREEQAIASPIAVLHYEKYKSKNELHDTLDANEEKIQCVVSNSGMDLKSSLRDRVVNFGNAQCPTLFDYADGVDTLEFLLQV